MVEADLSSKIHGVSSVSTYSPLTVDSTDCIWWSLLVSNCKYHNKSIITENSWIQRLCRSTTHDHRPGNGAKKSPILLGATELERLSKHPTPTNLSRSNANRGQAIFNLCGVGHSPLDHYCASKTKAERPIRLLHKFNMLYEFRIPFYIILVHLKKMFHRANPIPNNPG